MHDSPFSTSDTNDYVLACKDARGNWKLAAWTAGEAHEADIDPGLELRAEAKSVNIRDEPVSVSWKNGRLRLRLTGEPQHITIAAGKMNNSI